MTYYRDLASLVGINLIAVLGVFTLTGLTGLMSFGQTGFMAIGAYAAALSHMRLGIPWPLALGLGVVLACLLSVVLGYPSLRLKGDFFGLATFGFAEAVAAVFRMFSQVTGGTTGLGGIPRHTTIWIVVASVVVSIYLVANLKRSKLGRNSVAIRSDELAAESLGIDVLSHRLKVFVFSSGLAALAGGLEAFFLHYLDPRIFGFTITIEQIIVVYFGSINSLTGCIVSSLLLDLVPEAMQAIRQWRVVIYSVLIIFTLSVRPQGLMGDYEFSGSSARSLYDLVRRAKVRLLRRITGEERQP